MVFMGILAGVVSLLAYIPYIASIIRGKTVPSRTTWWILFFVGMVALMAYKDSGASNTTFFLVGDLVGSFLVALLSLLYGKDGFLFFDKICFLGAILSFGFWIFFQEDPSIAFSVSIVVEVIAMVPTLKKTYFFPLEEDVSGWLFTFFASIINLYAIENWLFIIVFYPFYEFFINGLMMFLLARGRKCKKIYKWNQKFIWAMRN